MRVTPFLVFTVLCLLVVLEQHQKAQGPPLGPSSEDMQQEEKVFTGEHPDNQFRVTYKAMGPDEEAIADIIWLRKAAKIAVGNGNPYFNVLKQDVTNVDNLTIEGVIELQDDPMMADYDGNEILGLVLAEESLWPN